MVTATAARHPNARHTKVIATVNVRKLLLINYVVPLWSWVNSRRFFLKLVYQ